MAAFICTVVDEDDGVVDEEGIGSVRVEVVIGEVA